MEMRMPIAAVVVTYNRKEELRKNLRAVLGQTHLVDRYYIIDNHGSDGTEAMLRAEELLDNPVVEYVYLPENIGGAGGFYTGVKMAYEAGFDYICLMDDDGRPADDRMMARLWETAQQLHAENPKLMLNSLVLDLDGERMAFGLTGINSKEEACVHAKDGVLYGTINPFNGTLISRELVTEIGLPNRDFFIKGDEEDYQLRATNAGALIATVTDSVYLHPIAEKKVVRIGRKEFRETTEAPWKEYYRARNLTYIFRRERKNGLWIRHVIRQALLALRHGNKKMKTVCRIMKGCVHGLSGKLGRTVEPGN